MTDQLTADVERWLAEQVRTTWPGKSGDCCDAGERADMARWFAGQIRAFGLWIAKTQPTYTFLIDGEAAVCPVTASEPPNSTPTAQETNRTPQSDVVNVIADRLMTHADQICELSPRPMSWMNLDANVRTLIAHLALEALQDARFEVGRPLDKFQDRCEGCKGEGSVLVSIEDDDWLWKPCPACVADAKAKARAAHKSDVVNTLLEAAGAARTRTLPPPKPGTHESDLTDLGLWSARRGNLTLDQTMFDPFARGGYWEFCAARGWSTANRQENA